MINKLKAEQATQDKMKDNHDYGYYNRKALPEVVAYNKQYRKENPEEYGYNQAIVDYIVEKENIPTGLLDILATQVYLSQQDITNEKKEEHKQKMIKENWLPLTEEVVKTAYNNNNKLLVKAVIGSDLMKQGIEKKYKPFVSKNGNLIMLMNERARTRGYYLRQFENAFCKIV